MLSRKVSFLKMIFLIEARELISPTYISNIPISLSSPHPTPTPHACELRSPNSFYPNNILSNYI